MHKGSRGDKWSIEIALFGKDNLGWLYEKIDDKIGHIQGSITVSII